MEKRLKLLDILLIMSIVLQDAGTFGFLPLNAFQIIVLLMGLVLGIEFIKGNIQLTKAHKVIVLIVYIFIVTFTHVFDFEAIKSLGYFTIEFAVLYLYYVNLGDKNKLLKVIYISASILSLYGIVQEIGYILKMPFIYDPTNWGFYRFFATPIGGGLICCYSLYAEPAHLAAVFCAGILIGLYRDDVTKQRLPFVNYFMTGAIVITTLLTGSATVYVGLVVVILYLVFTLDTKPIIKVIAVILFCAFLVGCKYAFNDIYQKVVVSRLLGLKNEFYTIGNMTTFAIISNFRVALAKMKDGYFFGTGFDSNRYYYFDYVDKIYGTTGVYMNSDEAASAFTRIFSEFGVVGIVVLFIWGVRKAIIAIIDKNNYLWIMILVFMIQGMRDGSYANILLALPFMAILLTDKEKVQ